MAEEREETQETPDLAAALREGTEVSEKAADKSEDAGQKPPEGQMAAEREEAAAPPLDEAARAGEKESLDQELAAALDTLWRSLLSQPAAQPLEGTAPPPPPETAAPAYQAAAADDLLATLEKAASEGDLDAVQEAVRRARQAAEEQRRLSELQSRLYGQLLGHLTADILGHEEPTAAEKAKLLTALNKGVEAYRQALLDIAVERRLKARTAEEKKRAEEKAAEYEKTGEKARSAPPDLPPAKANETFVINPKASTYDAIREALRLMDEQEHVAPRL